MSAAAASTPAPVSLADRPMPPITAIAVAAIVLVVTGGVFTASRLPRHVPLGLPIAMVVGAAILVLIGFVLMARIEPFAWRTFRRVAGWTLAAYVVVAGMLAYAFIYDHVRGAQLVVLLLMLLDFALDVTLLYGYSVARFQPAAG